MAASLAWRRWPALVLARIFDFLARRTRVCRARRKRIFCCQAGGRSFAPVASERVCGMCGIIVYLPRAAEDYLEPRADYFEPRADYPGLDLDYRGLELDYPGLH